MKRLLLLLTLSIACYDISFAQSDTSIMYLNEFGDTAKDKAVTYTTFHLQDSVWHGKEYFIKTGILKSEGNYREKGFAHPVGTFKNFSDKGILDNIAIFNDSSNIEEKTYFYENGMKKAWLLNPSYGGAFKQKCWDSLGKESAFCKIEVEARFKGGVKGWQRFLEKNLNASVAEESGAPVGSHTVEVYFIVDTKGAVSHILPAVIPEKCAACATEVVRILTISPEWEPATINGVPYAYKAKQYVTFVVEKSRQRRNKG